MFCNVSYTKINNVFFTQYPFWKTISGINGLFCDNAMIHLNGPIYDDTIKKMLEKYKISINDFKSKPYYEDEECIIQPIELISSQSQTSDDDQSLKVKNFAYKVKLSKLKPKVLMDKLLRLDLKSGPWIGKFDLYFLEMKILIKYQNKPKKENYNQAKMLHLKMEIY
jgi:hypothetical protein